MSAARSTVNTRTEYPSEAETIRETKINSDRIYLGSTLSDVTLSER